MQEWVLQHDELYAILNALNVHGVVGIQHGAFFSADKQMQTAMLQHGYRLLQQQGRLAYSSGGTPVFDAALITAVTALATPQVVIMTVRNQTGLGPQLFLLYQSSGLAVEQTFPKEGLHRLVLLGQADALKVRLGQLLPLAAISSTMIRVAIEQNAFFSAKRSIEQRSGPKALQVLERAGIRQHEGVKLIHALEHPTFKGNVALMRCINEEIVDARNIAFVQDEELAWSIAQRIPGEPMLTIETTTSEQAQKQLVVYYDELARST